MNAAFTARVSRSGKFSRQQVAAVCYRLRGHRLEFLLVQTRGGRWIFPKGGVEPGLSHAESAALEALEEAGVHGRIERIPFTRYYRHSADSAAGEPAVAAHLCEVARLESPQESNRRPSWFSPEKAKQRLRRDRAYEFGAELVRVVDRAAARIHRLRSAGSVAAHARVDGLQQVRFEAREAGLLYDELRRAARARYFLQRPPLQLPAATLTKEAPRNVTPIDSARRNSAAQAGSSSSKKFATRKS